MESPEVNIIYFNVGLLFSLSRIYLIHINTQLSTLLIRIVQVDIIVCAKDTVKDILYTIR